MHTQTVILEVNVVNTSRTDQAILINYFLSTLEGPLSTRGQHSTFKIVYKRNLVTNQEHWLRVSRVSASEGQRDCSLSTLKVVGQEAVATRAVEDMEGSHPLTFQLQLSRGILYT